MISAIEASKLSAETIEIENYKDLYILELCNNFKVPKDLIVNIVEFNEYNNDGYISHMEIVTILDMIEKQYHPKEPKNYKIVETNYTVIVYGLNYENFWEHEEFKKDLEPYKNKQIILDTLMRCNTRDYFERFFEYTVNDKGMIDLTPIKEPSRELVTFCDSIFMNNPILKHSRLFDDELEYYGFVEP